MLMLQFQSPYYQLLDLFLTLSSPPTHNQDGFGYATGAANNRLPGFLIAVLSLDAMLGVCLWVPLNKWLA